MMPSKKIRCPKCGGVLEVSNPQNVPSLLIQCPNPSCNARIRVAFDIGKTILATHKDKDVIGGLRWNDICYPLLEGKNTIGRKSPNSEATIQIPVNDMSMSRIHAEIEIVKLPNGRVKAILSDLRSGEKIQQKPLLKGNYPLDTVDRVDMCYGDVLLMGNTSLEYISDE